MHARIYDFTLTSGGMQRLPVVGDFFKVISATGTINVNVDTGATLDLMPGQGLREFNFNALTITDKSGAANSGTILVGFSGMIDDRVTGEVSIIEGGAQRTRSGLAFAVSHFEPGVAGNYGHVQLWNPAGSGKRAVVSELGWDLTATGTVQVRMHNAALSTFQTVGKSKRSGGALSVMEVRSQQDGVGIAGAGTIYGLSAGTQFFIHKLSEPIVVDPGYGVIVATTLAAAGVRGNFQYFEESV